MNTRVYLFDEKRANKLTTTDANELAYKPIGSQDRVWELCNSLSISDLMRVKVVSTKDKNFSVKGVVPEVLPNGSINKLVYIKECSTKKILK